MSISLFILVFAVVNKFSVIDGQMLGNKEPLADEDDDIDPFDDDGEPIDYPVKSMMPIRAMNKKNETKILSREGSGKAPTKLVMDFQMPGRVAKLEQYLVALSNKLSQQQQANNELTAAVVSQQQQRIQERVAFGNAVGGLQGAVAKLANKVDEIPFMINREKRRRYQEHLTSTINDVSQKLGQFSTRFTKSDKRPFDLRRRSTRSETGQLLGKLLGIDIDKEQKKLTNKEESKPASPVSNAIQVPPSVIKSDPREESTEKITAQPLIPMDLLPISHQTSLSTPSGQGPAGSSSTTPVQPNFSFVQNPSLANIAAPSTPFGSGPAGSSSTSAGFQAPSNIGGYNVLPLVPVPQQIAQHEPLESPGTITPKAEASSLTSGIATVPSATSPYEILTSSQMLQNTPRGAAGGTFEQRSSGNVGTPYEVLTSSQLNSRGHPVTKAGNEDGKVGKKMNMDDDNARIEEHKEEKDGCKKCRKPFLAMRSKKKKQDKQIKGKVKQEKRKKQVKSKKLWNWQFNTKKKGREKSKKESERKVDYPNPIKKSNEKKLASTIQSKLMEDHVLHDLIKAMKMGSFRKVEY